MKKAVTIIGVFLVVVALFLTAGFFFIKTRPIPEVAVGEVELAQVQDGTYTGEYKEGLVVVQVQVEVKDHAITDIQLVQHQNGMGSKAEEIVEAIMSQQSLQVDAISGATLSSNVIRRAVEEALTQ